jgi:hypothetical protein
LSTGTTPSDARKINDPEREVKELKRANEMLLGDLLALRAGARPATAAVTVFIDEVRKEFGVQADDLDWPRLGY